MKKKILLFLVALVAAAGLLSVGLTALLNNRLSMTVVDSYEVSYGQPVSVYKLIRSINHRDVVELSIEAQGELTDNGCAVAFPKAGDYSITIHAVTPNQHTSARTTIHVTDEVPPLIESEDFTIILGDTADFLAHVSAYDEQDGDLTRLVMPDSRYVHYDEPGRYPVTYTVTDAAGNSASTTSYLHITRAPASEILLDKTELWLAGNEYQLLHAEVEPSDWEGTLFWETSDPSVCTVVDGFVVWTGKGECTVTVSADEITAECTVYCVDPHLTTLWLNQRTLELDEHQSAQLTCRAFPSNWPGDAVWSSSNPSVATVTDGRISWVGPGTCTITVSAEGVSDRCTVTCAGKTWTDHFWDFLGGRSAPSEQEESIPSEQ